MRIAREEVNVFKRDHSKPGIREWGLGIRRNCI
jgi:hypothetical protein